MRIRAANRKAETLNMNSDLNYAKKLKYFIIKSQSSLLIITDTSIISQEYKLIFAIILSDYLALTFPYSLNQIFCRTGISPILPYGNNDWLFLPGTFKYVSCGDYGCWAIKPDNSIAFRTGVTFDYPQGTRWIDVDGSFVQLEAGYQGRVYAVTSDNHLYYRSGICAFHPTGNRWREAKGVQGCLHVTVGKSSMFVITTNGTIFTSS